MGKYNTETVQVNPVRIFKIGGVIAILIFMILAATSVFESVDMNQIMCVQSPVKGTLTWSTTAGVKWQGFGKVTKYSKRSIYKFEFPVRFNDAGHGVMKGSIQFDMPLDKEHLDKIQSKYGSENAVKEQLLQTVVNKCLYLTGPMMSSRESYAEKRSYLINYVQDQIANGVYKTRSRDTTMKDAISSVEKTVTITEITQKNGLPERQEEAILKEFGIRAFNFSIEQLAYDKTVEDQIQQQQRMVMGVQTAIADAKKAEQDAITAEANGKAKAMSAKWEQEAIKATEVTKAETQRDVAEQAMKAAEFKKKALILEGEGESTKKRLILQADGALEKKLDAWVQSQTVWADAFSKYGGSVVPQIQTGGGTSGGNGAVNFMEIMGIKAARDLSLDMKVPQGAK